jgi:hypothetical protein
MLLWAPLCVMGVPFCGAENLRGGGGADADIAFLTNEGCCAYDAMSECFANLVPFCSYYVATSFGNWRRQHDAHFRFARYNNMNDTSKYINIHHDNSLRQFASRMLSFCLPPSFIIMYLFPPSVEVYSAYDMGSKLGPETGIPIVMFLRSTICESNSGIDMMQCCTRRCHFKRVFLRVIKN